MNDYALKMEVRKSTVEGEVTASPSKSQTHRAIICSALAEGVSTVFNPLLCDDTEATLQACSVLGAEILSKSEEKIVIRGTGGVFKINEGRIDCKESGSTMRFLAPLAAISGGKIYFEGRPSLERRPISELLSVLAELGASVDYLQDIGSLPFVISSKGKPSGTRIRISGNVTSQFISGLLFALPLLRGDSIITITTELQSTDYVDLTIDTLRRFGISIHRTRDFREITVKGEQVFRATEIAIEGDYSSSAYLLVAGAIASGERGLTIRNLKRDSKQGDRKIVTFLREMGGDVEVGDSFVTVKRSVLHGAELDVTDTPDLVPPLVIASACSEGKTLLRGTGRLRLKESDRVESIAEMMTALGCDLMVEKDSMSVEGGIDTSSTLSFDFSDHRLVMSACLAGLVRTGRTIVLNPVAVKKSYPDFFDHLRTIGGDLAVISNSIGSRLRFSVYGESHGRRIGAVLEGVPRGIKVERDYIQREMDRRRSTTLLTTARKEPDIVEILSGIEEGITTGETVMMEIRNMDVISADYAGMKDFIRPGHADYTARQKYRSVFDYRGGGFLSGRMTVAFVAAGAIAKKIIETRGIKIFSRIVQIGKIIDDSNPPDEELENMENERVIRCADPLRSREMQEAIEDARKLGDSLGGVVECRIVGLPVGIGEPIFHSLESEISRAMFAIPAVKGIEFGSGFRGAAMRGSENNDPFVIREGRVVTLTNNSGGILGGISNGMTVVFRVAFKPTSSIPRVQRTVNVSKGEEATFIVKGRHDPCIALRAPPIVEAMAALTIADLMIISGEI
ncbi:MAG: chorismate synthase [Thermoplasmata archaeon]